MEYGLIGEGLSHSFPEMIYQKTGLVSYEVQDLSPEQADAFIRTRDFRGINVTGPCRRTVLLLLDEISGQARRLGAVDTIVNKEGKLTGYNTEYFGLKSLIIKAGLDLKGRKVLILGTGETGRTAHAVVTDLDCAQVYKAGRSGKEGAVTCEEIYNPLRTALVLEAQKRGIPAAGGLYMLTARVVRSAELFTDSEIIPGSIDRIYNEVLNSRRNIVLTGMSLAGKTTVGTLLSKTLGRELADTDDMIVETEQRPITDIFAADGEGYFRDVETEMTRRLSPKTGIIIATGGGVILRQQNVDALKKNGVIVFLDRPLEQILPADDRPLANTRDKVVALHKKRYPTYCSTCDYRVPNGISPEDVMARIFKVLNFSCV